MDYNLTRNIFTLLLTAHLMKHDEAPRGRRRVMFTGFNRNQIFHANIF